MKLSGTDETIPTLADALTLIGHRAMVYIELKTPFGEVGELEKQVSEILLDHNGPTAVIGFNPYSHAWFADHQPQILRGLDSYSWNDESARKLAPEMRKSLAALEQVEIARPDFLALGLDMLPSARADLYRAKGMPIIAWTVRSADQWEASGPLRQPDLRGLRRVTAVKAEVRVHRASPRSAATPGTPARPPRRSVRQLRLPERPGGERLRDRAHRLGAAAPVGRGRDGGWRRSCRSI
jgi:hypothetical protein